jgi:hypothetical protein
MTLYSAPKNFNAEIIGSVDTAGVYEYRILLVMKDKTTGKLYYEVEFGCSCPSPFELYNSVTELREIVSADEFAVAARNYIKTSEYATLSDREYVERLISSVQSRMRKRAA